MGTSFQELKPIYISQPFLQGNEEKYVVDALRSGWLTHHGSYEKKFEQEFSKLVKKPSLATSSGTAALHLALLSLGIGPDDEVIVPSLTFGATASVVKAVGAKPVLVDVDGMGLLDRRMIRINERTKAIMPVHLYGEDAGSYSQFGVPVIEDACEALGMLQVLRADITCFSFYANKTITTGEGGMICGRLGKAEAWRNGGFDEHYYHSVPGLNYRMTNLQAAVGCAQLEQLPTILKKRARVVQRYRENLVGFGKWLFVVRTPSPRDLSKHLKARGIETRPVFYPLHLMSIFAQTGDFTNSELLWKTGLCLPTGPHLSDADVDRIIEGVNEYHQL